ncbi:MAG TPA: phosphoribosylanthranilate isomerase [SAR324 cluster bacterium]|nr:phosphoribosylanthranilate isomerase [SAR324 cluster bacterium]
MPASAHNPIRIKVCGITTPEQAEACIDLGANMIGINCWKPSPRYVDPEKLAVIVHAIAGRVETVALFVNENPLQVNRLMEQYPLDTAQLHGDETPDYTRELKFPWFKAFRVNDDFQPSLIVQYGQTRFLLDAYSKNRYGGTGRTFDWEIAIHAKQQGKLMLAGGLTPDNAAEAVKRVQPVALDVCSGVESQPGIKDLEAVKRFIQNARGANRETPGIMMDHPEHEPLSRPTS